MHTFKYAWTQTHTLFFQMRRQSYSHPSFACIVSLHVFSAAAVYGSQNTFNHFRKWTAFQNVWREKFLPLGFSIHFDFDIPYIPHTTWNAVRHIFAPIDIAVVVLETYKILYSECTAECCFWNLWINFHRKLQGAMVVMKACITNEIA